MEPVNTEYLYAVQYKDNDGNYVIDEAEDSLTIFESLDEAIPCLHYRIRTRESVLKRLPQRCSHVSLISDEYRIVRYKLESVLRSTSDTLFDINGTL